MALNIAKEITPLRRVTAPRYKNQTFEVRVLPRGFEFEGDVNRTPSAVAK